MDTTGTESKLDDVRPIADPLACRTLKLRRTRELMGDQSPESLIRAMLLSGPGDSFEDLVAPGARLLPFMAPRGFEGPEGAREYWEEARGSGWAVSIEIDSVRTLGGMALASGTLHARRGSIDQRNDLSWGARVKDGLIQEFCAFTDPLAAERWLTE